MFPAGEGAIEFEGARRIGEACASGRTIWRGLGPGAGTSDSAGAVRLSQVTWERLASETVAFGSPDTVARHIETTRALGVGQVLCWMNFGGLPQDKIRRSMELLAREVMPHFRDA